MGLENYNGSNLQFSLEQIVAPCGRKQLPPPKDNKVEHNSHLGTYSAAVSPLIFVGIGIICSVYAFRDLQVDPRVKGWLLMECPVSMMVIAVLYILASMVWGPRYMKNREPMQLKNVMIIYNFFQVVLSFYMFIEIGLTGWFFDYNYRCQPCDYSLDDKPVRMARVSHLFFLTKILDFVDTGLFIARGKLSQVSNLHVIHHSCMFSCMWAGVHYIPGGHITFMGFLNTFIHTVMYSYYLLAALGPRVKPYLWWKRYLTRMQLVQFVAIFLHTAQLIVFPCDGVPNGLVISTLFYAFLFFALFINFYMNAYLFGKKNVAPAKNISTENGIASNGIGVHSNGVHQDQDQPNGVTETYANESANGSTSHYSLNESAATQRQPLSSIN